jgi:hypothetical protein
VVCISMVVDVDAEPHYITLGLLGNDVVGGMDH